MNNFEYQIKKADDLIAQGKVLHAIQVYQSMISVDISFTPAYVKLADLYSRIDRYDSAINLLEKYLLEYPEDKAVRLYLGQMFLKNLMWNEAIDTLSLVFPDEYPIASFLLGFAFFNIKDYEIAKLNFYTFLERDSNSEFKIQAEIFLAKIELELDNLDEAYSLLVNIEKIFGNNWEVLLLFGIYYYKKEMFQHSINSFKKAIKLNVDETSLHNWIGKAYFRMGDYLKAENSFRECIADEKATSETYSYLGLACLNANKKEDAHNFFNIALNLDPENEVALEGKKKCEP